jgi:DNA-binding XRE family transcriptional regulator
MASATIDQSYEGLSVHAKPAVLALSVLVERLQSLSSADRDALLELLVAMGKSEDAEEKRDMVRAMEEILTQAPVVVHQMAMDDAPMPKGLKTWSVHVGKRVRKLRKKASMSQSELADKAGLDQSHISRIENAEYSPTHMTLEKIADALGVPVDDFEVRRDS